KLPVGRQMACSRDGKFFALTEGARDGVEIRDPSGRTLRRLSLCKEGHYAEPQCCLAFSPDGRILAVGFHGFDAEDGSTRHKPSLTVQLFDWAAGKRVLQTRLSPRAPERIAYSPDGRALAVAEVGGAVQLYDAVTGRERFRLPEDRSGRDWNHIHSLVFSP